MSVDLSTTYLGIELKNPLVAAACPLTGKMDSLVRLEEAGVAAAVLPSLFEEQIEHDEIELTHAKEYGSEFYAEHGQWYPDPGDYRFGPDDYLAHIEEAKKTTSIPVIASLNGSSAGGWVNYAKKMQDAGADALELNIYFVPTDLDVTGEAVENQYLELVASVKGSIAIPVAVKIGPYFSSMTNMAKKLAEAGADGLVLFNRYLAPDLDLDELQVTTSLALSSSHELCLPLRWLAILRGRVDLSLAATSGIHDEKDLAKALLVGADVGMVASTLYQNGTQGIATTLQGLERWMEEKGYERVEQFKGSMSRENCPDPTAFARGNYMKTLSSFTGEFA